VPLLLLLAEDIILSVMRFGDDGDDVVDG